MRLFTAIDLSEEAAGKLEKLIAQLEPLARVRWSPAANLHLTLKFIGTWPEERLAELEQALRTLPGRAPIPIAVRKLGWFPNPHSPRVFWAGVEAPPELAALAGELDEALADLGIEPEQRAYSPHLTLARIKQPARLAALTQAIAKLPSIEFGSFTAEQFYLYRSQPSPSGSRYTKLSEFPFLK